MYSSEIIQLSIQLTLIKRSRLLTQPPDRTHENKPRIFFFFFINCSPPTAWVPRAHEKCVFLYFVRFHESHNVCRSNDFERNYFYFHEMPFVQRVSSPPLSLPSFQSLMTLSRCVHTFGAHETCEEWKRKKKRMHRTALVRLFLLIVNDEMKKWAVCSSRLIRGNVWYNKTLCFWVGQQI